MSHDRIPRLIEQIRFSNGTGEWRLTDAEIDELLLALTGGGGPDDFGDHALDLAAALVELAERRRVG